MSALKFALQIQALVDKKKVIITETSVRSDLQLKDAKDVELKEEEKLARQREEDANIAEWDDVQAMMDADYELAARLQAEEQRELTIKEKSRLVGEELKSENLKKQKLDENVEAEVDADQEEAKDKKQMKT
ncbi:hypothetical protein Tco_0462846 [Tanacetum coccineum]